MNHATQHSPLVESSARPSETRSLFALLASPFEADELEWRVGRAGIKDGKPWASVVLYIDARAARNRLNTVVGHENWRVAYSNGPGNGVLASLSIRVDGEWITKQDGADTTDIAPTKGGISASFKRAAAVWGIGEYLYDVGAAWAEFHTRGSRSCKIEGQSFKWDPPLLEARFLPKGMASATARAARPEIVRNSDQPVKRLPTASMTTALEAPASKRGTHDSASADNIMTMEKANAMTIPFGKMKHENLGERILTDRDDVKSGRDWAANKQRYLEYVAAVDILTSA